MEIFEVVVADSCEVARIGMRVLLDTAPGLRVLAEAADEAAVLRALEHYQPRVLVLAIEMLEASPTLLPSLRDASPGTALLIALPDTAAKLPRGTDGCVLSCATGSDLHEAVATVARGGKYGVPATDDGDDLHAALSPRELLILRAMVEGHTQREIAEQLQLSVRSVESYRARISERLGLESRAELVRYALRTGLLRSKLDLHGKSSGDS